MLHFFIWMKKTCLSSICVYIAKNHQASNCARVGFLVDYVLTWTVYFYCLHQDCYDQRWYICRSTTHRHDYSYTVHYTSPMSLPFEPSKVQMCTLCIAHVLFAILITGSASSPLEVMLYNFHVKCIHTKWAWWDWNQCLLQQRQVQCITAWLHQVLT